MGFDLDLASIMGRFHHSKALKTLSAQRSLHMHNVNLSLNTFLPTKAHLAVEERTAFGQRITKYYVDSAMLCNLKLNFLGYRFFLIPTCILFVVCSV